ncbi:Bug family tripartite tricarboxylate transporter substrate binding protein [Thermodesulfobacteriota bacterium]
MKRWKIIWLACGITFIAFLGIAHAQEKYPNRRIEMVIPFAPGGSSDLLTRIYSEDLTRELNVPIILVNRPGGSGVRGFTYLTSAKKDGYTLAQGASATIIFASVFMRKNVPYDVQKDLAPIGHFATMPGVITVRSDSPFQTLDELVEYARNNPGKLKHGSAGVSVQDTINVKLLSLRKNVKISQIPFKGGAGALTAILGGHSDMCGNVFSTVGPHIKAGALRGLATFSEKRHKNFPNIPTLKELGYGSGYLIPWYSFFAPEGVPQARLDVLITAFKRVSQNPEVVRRLTNAGYVVDYKNPEEFRKIIASDLRTVEKIARDAGLIKE